MEAMILAVHLMLATGLVITVLMQRSEGGALGIGGGGGFMAGRGSANTLTKLTAYLAAAFFVTSILLTLMAQNRGQGRSAFDRAPTTPAAPSAPATPGAPPATPPAGPSATAPASPTTPAGPSGGILDRLKQQQPGAPRLPQGQ